MEKREEVGRRGGQYAEQNLSLTVAAEKYIELISRIKGFRGKG